MTASDKALRTRERRSRVYLPESLVKDFRATTEQRGVPGSTLVYGWITQAARFARANQFDLIPPRSSSPSTSGSQLPIDYPQSAVEAAECTALLRNAGSSVRAVVAACIQAYVEADGNPVTMNWPQREHFLVA